MQSATFNYNWYRSALLFSSILCDSLIDDCHCEESASGGKQSRTFDELRLLSGAHAERSEVLAMTDHHSSSNRLITPCCSFLVAIVSRETFFFKNKFCSFKVADFIAKFRFNI